MAATSDETEKREAVQYRTLSDKIDQVASGQTKLEVALGRLEASMMPRHEIAAAVAERVPMTIYLSDKAALEMQIKELKAAPQATWVKAGILISSGVGCLSLIIGAAGVIIALLVATGTLK